MGYILDEKVPLNNKYIKTKQNRKLRAKFFDLFQVFYPVHKQAYKLELFTQYRIHDVFHVSLLEWNTTIKNKFNKLMELESELDIEEDREYEIKTIKDSAFFTKIVEVQLQRLYYLIFWKVDLDDEST